MKPKTKTKKNVRKFGRNKFDTKDPPIVETPSCDLSSLRKPIDTSISSLRHVTKLFETGSEEIKCLLAYECEVVYECRICRSLFRSLVNFISHKRIYCPEKFSITTDKSAINPPEMTCENSVDPESEENCKVDRSSKNHVATKERKKDLTSIVAMLQKKKNGFDYDEVKENNRRMRIVADTEQILLEVLESNHAAFQTILEPKIANIETNDLMKAQTAELQDILSCDTAILGPDGCVLELSSDEKCDTPVQFSEKAPSISIKNLTANTNLICSICDTKFATKKTLTFHMKSLHTPNRMVYPCPSCDNLYPNTWGVYRHLIKVHRKSNAQVRKLRGEIQAKAYRKETTRAEDIEKDCAVRKLNDLNDSQSSVNETQEWMAHLESDGELQRCGGCGKRFDRKAALLAHSQICQRRLAACNDVALKSKRSKPTPEVVVETVNPVPTPAVNSPPAESENIPTKEMQPPSLPVVPSPPPPPPPPPPPTSSTSSTSSSSASSSSSTSSTSSSTTSTSLLKSSDDNVIRLPNISSAVTITRLPQEQQPPIEISIRVEGVSSLSKDAWDKIVTDAPELSPGNNSINEIDRLDTPCNTTPLENINTDMSDDPEIIFTKIEKSKNVAGNNGSRKRKLGKRDVSTVESNKRSRLSSSPEILDKTDSPKVVSSSIIERERRVATIANLRKLQCIPCKRKFTSLTYLRRHMAGHINWYCFRCKLCDFKCIDRIDCLAHCNKVHNAKNNRTIIANMMMETVPDNVTNSPRSILKKPRPPRQSVDVDVIDVTKPATEFHDIINRKNIKCIQNGKTKQKKPKKSDTNDGSYCSQSDDDTPNETNELAKNSRLDEDPALRRMVMEVIFGSSETIANEKLNSSTEKTELGGDPNSENCEDQSNSSSNSDSDINSNGSTNETAGKTVATKRNSKRVRATRNRTKLEDKDFIYDLDAVLLKEPVDEDLCAVKIIDNNGINKNNVDTSKCEKHSNDLSAVVCKDNLMEGTVEKVA